MEQPAGILDPVPIGIVDLAAFEIEVGNGFPRVADVRDGPIRQVLRRHLETEKQDTKPAPRSP
jgi:hypothetical protein